MYPIECEGYQDVNQSLKLNFSIKFDAPLPPFQWTTETTQATLPNPSTAATSSSPLLSPDRTSKRRITLSQSTSSYDNGNNQRKHPRRRSQPCRIRPPHCGSFIPSSVCPRHHTVSPPRRRVSLHRSSTSSSSYQPPPDQIISVVASEGPSQPLLWGYQGEDQTITNDPMAVLGTDEATNRAQFREGIDLAVMTFNIQGPHACFDMLEKRELLKQRNPVALASFIFFVPGLDKQQIGKLIGGETSQSARLLDEFLHLFCFSQVDIVGGIRLLFSKFQPPGFSTAFVADNKCLNVSIDHVLLLSYAVIMLHTDRHNTHVRRKMSKEEFLKLIPQSQDQSESILFQRGYLEKVYDDVTASEFHILLSETDLVYNRLSRICFTPYDLTSSKTKGIDDVLKTGVTFMKYCRNGAIKMRVVMLSEDGLRLVWAPEGSPTAALQKSVLKDSNRPLRRSIWIDEILDVTIGPNHSNVFQRVRVPSSIWDRCCSIHTPHRTLDLCFPLGLVPTVEVWAAAVLLKTQHARRSVLPQPTGGTELSTQRGRVEHDQAEGTDWCQAESSRRWSVSCPPRRQCASCRTYSEDPYCSRKRRINRVLNKWPTADRQIVASPRNSRESEYSSIRQEDLATLWKTEILPNWWHHWNTCSFRLTRKENTNKQKIENTIPEFLRQLSGMRQMVGQNRPGRAISNVHLNFPSVSLDLVPRLYSASQPILFHSPSLTRSISSCSNTAAIISSRPPFTAAFAARLDAVRRSLTPAVFDHLLTGAVRVPCTEQPHRVEDVSPVILSHFWDVGLLDSVRRKSFCHILRQKRSTRCARQQQQRWDRRIPALPDNMSKVQVTGRSPVLLGLWWAGLLPSVLRGLLWTLCVTGSIHPILMKTYKFIDKDNIVVNRLNDASRHRTKDWEGCRSWEVLCALSHRWPTLILNSKFVRLSSFVVSVTDDPARAFCILDGVVTETRLPAGIFLLNQEEEKKGLTRLLLFQTLFAKTMPLLFQHFKALDLEPYFYLPKWFGYLFTGVVPDGCLVRLWDRILIGHDYLQPVVYRIALGILRYYELKLLTSSFEGCLRILNWEFSSCEEPSIEDPLVELHMLRHFDEQRFWRSLDICAVEQDPDWLDMTERWEESLEMQQMLK